MANVAMFLFLMIFLPLKIVSHIIAVIIFPIYLAVCYCKDFSEAIDMLYGHLVKEQKRKRSKNVSNV